MDLGFHTHGVSLSCRYVGLVSSYDADTGALTITGREQLWKLGSLTLVLMTCFKTAPNAFVYPPGPAYLSVNPFFLLITERESVTDTVWHCNSGTFWATVFLPMERKS